MKFILAILAGLGSNVAARMFNVQGAIPLVVGVVAFFLVMGLKD